MTRPVFESSRCSNPWALSSVPPSRAPCDPRCPRLPSSLAWPPWPASPGHFPGQPGQGLVHALRRDGARGLHVPGPAVPPQVEALAHLLHVQRPGKVPLVGHHPQGRGEGLERRKRARPFHKSIVQDGNERQARSRKGRKGKGIPKAPPQHSPRPPAPPWPPAASRRRCCPPRRRRR